jgi:hypothetical protein
VEDGPSGLVDSEEGVLSGRAAVVGVAGDEVGLLGHAHFLDILHTLGVLFAHEGHALVGPFYIFEGLHQQIFLRECCESDLLFLPLSLLLFALLLFFLHALLVLVAAVVDVLAHFLLSLALWIMAGVHYADCSWSCSLLERTSPSSEGEGGAASSSSSGLSSSEEESSLKISYFWGLALGLER